MVPVRFPDMPARVARLARDARGFPVPWFVSWQAGTPRFPVIDAAKLALAWTTERCWVCGEALGAWRGWIVGPMSALEGATPEPPSHCECAAFAVRACPHLVSADARFTQDAAGAAGDAPQRNLSRLRTDVTAVWVTRGRGASPLAANGGVLFRLEAPARLEWWSRGQPASGDAVRAAVAAALPILRRTAEAEGRVSALNAQLRWLERWIPADPVPEEAGRET